MKSLLSVDLEDWFQVENLRDAIPRSSWENQESRIEKNVDKVLGILDEEDTKATFFCLGWIAERFSGLIKKIHKEGHEIASHGYSHDVVYNLRRDEFSSDLIKSKDLLENIIGEKVIGYRAPNFSITDWAIDILIEHGFVYDSSLFPTMVNARYGKLINYDIQDKPCLELKEGFYEVLLSYISIVGKNLPWAGGGYFRLTPYWFFKKGVEHILKKKDFVSIYVHPWEFDPTQPRIKNIKLQYRFRHYINLKRTESKFALLLKDFKFQPIINYIKEIRTNL
jgi:polysaccharide deacetylase family protein (PEP-CTERM system associated)